MYIRNINCEFIKYDAHATCLAYYGFFLDRQFRGDVAISVFLKTMASYNRTSLTPLLFIEVHVLSHCEWSCICVLGISNCPISTIFLLNFWNFFDDVILFFHFYYRLWKNNSDDESATGPPREVLQGGTKVL